MPTVANLRTIRQFDAGANGARFSGTCTQSAAAVILTAANRLPSDYQSVVNLMIAMTQSMIARGKADRENGATWMSAIKEEIERRGGKTALFWDYDGLTPLTLKQDWIGLLRQYAGIKPIMVQVAFAHRIVTADGQPRNAGVERHAIAIVGKSERGYLVADGNSPTATNGPEIYPLPSLIAASPYSLLMLEPQGGTMPIPTNWTDANGVLTAPNGVKVIRGFREYLLNNPAFASFAGLPLTKEYSTGNTNNRDGSGVEQIFERGGLCWTEGKGVYLMDTGRLLEETRDAMNDARARIAQVEADLATRPNAPSLQDALRIVYTAMKG
jgi:hypothetical protein